MHGSDRGGGTLARPYATLGKAVSVARPGQTIALPATAVLGLGDRRRRPGGVS